MLLSPKPFLAATALLLSSVIVHAQSGCPSTYLEGNRSSDRSIEDFFKSISASGNQANIFLDWVEVRTMNSGDIRSLQGKPFQQWSRDDWQNLISVLRSLPTQSNYLASHLQGTTPALKQEVLSNLENKISVVRCYSEAILAAQAGKSNAGKDSERSLSMTGKSTGRSSDRSSDSRSAPREATEACRGNADYVGVRGNERAVYIRNCLNDRGHSSSADDTVATEGDLPATDGGKNRNPAAFRYDSHKNQCISVIQSPSGGPYQGIRNSCGFTVDVIFCIENGVDAKGDCSKRNFKRLSLAAGNYEVIDSYQGGMTAKVFAIACREPYYTAPSKTTFKGDKIAGDCQAEKKR